MDAYLKVVQELTAGFESFKLTRVPRGGNVKVNALAALGSSHITQVRRTIPVHKIERPSITLLRQATGCVAQIANAPESETIQTDEEMTASHIKTHPLTGDYPSSTSSPTGLSQRTDGKSDAIELEALITSSRMVSSIAGRRIKSSLCAYTEKKLT